MSSLLILSPCCNAASLSLSSKEDLSHLCSDSVSTLVTLFSSSFLISGVLSGFFPFCPPFLGVELTKEAAVGAEEEVEGAEVVRR